MIVVAKEEAEEDGDEAEDPVSARSSKGLVEQATRMAVAWPTKDSS